MMQEFKNVKELSVFLRDEIDKYSGQALPKEFVDLYNNIRRNNDYRKMIYRGKNYSTTFSTVLRNYRIELLDEIELDTSDEQKHNIE